MILGGESIELDIDSLYVVSQDKHRAHLEVLESWMDPNNSLWAIQRSPLWSQPHSLAESRTALEACGIDDIVDSPPTVPKPMPPRIS